MNVPEPTPGAVIVPMPSLSHEAHRVISWVLRGGMLVSAILLLTALVTFALRYPMDQLAAVIAANPIRNYLSVSGLASGLARGRSEAFLTAGILALAATPMARVAAGWYYFRQAKERTIARVTGTVLLLVLLGFFVVGPLLR